MGIFLHLLSALGCGWTIIRNVIDYPWLGKLVGFGAILLTIVSWYKFGDTKNPEWIPAAVGLSGVSAYLIALYFTDGAVSPALHIEWLRWTAISLMPLAFIPSKKKKE